MTELIADLPYRVVDAAGGEYFASVAAEQRADGVWDAWLEFVPTDESDAFVTDVETTQSTRADLVHWAENLTETYVQGSFSRAVAATTGSRLVTRKVDIEPLPVSPTTEVPIGLEDPFELYARGGKAGLRVASLRCRARRCSRSSTPSV